MCVTKTRRSQKSLLEPLELEVLSQDVGAENQVLYKRPLNH